MAFGLRNSLPLSAVTDLTSPRAPIFAMRASARGTALWLILPIREMTHLRVMRSTRTSNPPRPPMHDTTVDFVVSGFEPLLRLFGAIGEAEPAGHDFRGVRPGALGPVPIGVIRRLAVLDGEIAVRDMVVPCSDAGHVGSRQRLFDVADGVAGREFLPKTNVLNNSASLLVTRIAAPLFALPARMESCALCGLYSLNTLRRPSRLSGTESPIIPRLHSRLHVEGEIPWMRAKPRIVGLGPWLTRRFQSLAKRRRSSNVRCFPGT